MKGLPEKFGKKRIIDSPVSEAAVTGIATGASLHDMKPIVVHPRMDFMLLAADAIINQSAKWKFMLGGANSPNVWLTIEYENMAAMEQTKEKYDAVNAVLAERYGDDEEELDKISKGYEEIRRMVDNQRINQVNFKM